jgi:acetyl esterase
VAATERLLRLPEPLLAALTWPRWRVDGVAIDRHFQLVLRANRALGVSVNADDLAASRASLRRVVALMDAPGPDAGPVRDEQIAGGAGPIGVRVYAGRGAARGVGSGRPACVFYHGGGFCQGDLDTHDGLCRRIARAIGGPVVAVDYRLAPENPFPAAVEDAVAAYAWVEAQAAELGADPARIGVAGDSAGGNLAAVVSGQRIDAGLAPPAAQLLFYPSLDNRSAGRRRPELAVGYGLERADVEAYRVKYGVTELDGDERVSPGRRPNLAGMPPTVMATAGFDLLCQEGEDYAAALAEAGVTVVNEGRADLIHGYALMTKLPAAARAVDDALGAFAALLGG